MEQGRKNKRCSDLEMNRRRDAAAQLSISPVRVQDWQFCHSNPGTAGTKGEIQVSRTNKGLGKQHEARLAGGKGHFKSCCYPNTVTNTDIIPSTHKGLKFHQREALLQWLELWIRDHFLGMQQGREILSFLVLQRELFCTALQRKENNLLQRIHSTALHVNDIGKLQHIQKITQEMCETVQRCICSCEKGSNPYFSPA